MSNDQPATLPTAHLDDFLVAAGPAIEAVEILRYDDGLWMLDFPDSLSLQAQVDGGRGTLMLTTVLGTPVPGTEQEAYRLLLEVSGWWPVTGALRMALDAEDGSVLQVTDIPLDGLDAAALREQLLTFLSRARLVREALADMTPDGLDAPGEPALRVFSQDHFLRA